MRRWINAMMRQVYRVAYPIFCTWARVSGRQLRGTQVLLWYRGEVLLLRAAYHSEIVLPGGGLKRGEASAEGAARELREETGVRVACEALRFEGAVSFNVNGMRGSDDIYSVVFETPPELCIDEREIVAANFYPPQQAAQLLTQPELSELIVSQADS